MVCPECQSDKIEKSNRTESSKVGWKDGLGSPGTLIFKIDVYVCKNCDYYWESGKSLKG